MCNDNILEYSTSILHKSLISHELDKFSYFDNIGHSKEGQRESFTHSGMGSWWCR